MAQEETTGSVPPPTSENPSAGSPEVTPSLRRAEKWARHRRDGASWGWGVFGGTAREPLLRIHHGSAPIFVRDLGKCLMVLGYVDVVPEVRQAIGRAPAEEREEFRVGLQGELMACPRIGYVFLPTPLHDLAALERIALDQTLQIAENDPASFNRFCDAIQETETALLRVTEFLRQFLRAEAPSVYSSGSPAPTEIYL